MLDKAFENEIVFSKIVAMVIQLTHFTAWIYNPDLKTFYGANIYDIRSTLWHGLYLFSARGNHNFAKRKWAI